MKALSTLINLQALALVEQREAWRRFTSLPSFIELSRGTAVGVTPHDVVFTKHTMRLLRYRRDTVAQHAEPVLLCYALVNRPYILDLQPNKSVVEQYLKRGFEVYMIDWGVPSDGDRGLTLEDYVCDFLQAAVDHVLHDGGRGKLHLLGYCMGGTFSAMLAALKPHLVETLTLLATPIDFTGSTSLLAEWTKRNHFDVDAFVNAYGNCPAWFLQMCFLNMKPVQNVLEKNVALYEQMKDPKFLSSYFAMERWVNDNIPVAGETFREFVKKLYQENQLVSGRLRLGSQRIDLGRITCPLLLLTASQDHLVPPSSTEGIRPYVASKDVTSLSVDAGHVGLVVGGKAQKQLWPEATRWLVDRSTPRAPGRNVGTGASHASLRGV